MASARIPRDPLSETLAAAVRGAAPSTVCVRSRPGSPASGIAFAGDLVITADHVLAPEGGGDLHVGLPNGDEVVASLVGRDPATDIALLRLPETVLAPATPDPADPEVGSVALLVARPGRDVLASFGMVAGVAGPTRSAHRGVLERVIYVDAVMYPGFSGGPLASTAGHVLGMATSGLALAGPSIAIPWGVLTRIAAAIAEHGRVRRGYLGMSTQPVDLAPGARSLAGGQARALLVVGVAEDGPAARAGFMQGDILLRLSNSPVPVAEAMLGDVFYADRMEALPMPTEFNIPVPGPPFPLPPPLTPPGIGPLRPDGDFLFVRHTASGPPGLPGANIRFLQHRAAPPGAGIRFLRHPAEGTYVDDLQALLGPELVGTTVVASVLRGGELRDVEVVVGARDSG